MKTSSVVDVLRLRGREEEDQKAVDVRPRGKAPREKARAPVRR